MAGVLFHATSGEVTCSGSAKTILQIKSAANQRALVKAIRVFGKAAAGGTDSPAKLRLTRSTANFGTGSSGTIANHDPTDSESLQTVANNTFTVEPTSPTDAAIMMEINPQVGYAEFLAPGEGLPIPGGQSLNFELTGFAGTPIFVVSVDGEE